MRKILIRGFIFVVCGLIIGAVIGAAWTIYDNNILKERVTNNFNASAKQNFAILKHELLQPLEDLSTLSRYFEGSEAIEKSEFAVFTSPWTAGGMDIRYAAIPVEAALPRLGQLHQEENAVLPALLAKAREGPTFMLYDANDDKQETIAFAALCTSTRLGSAYYLALSFRLIDFLRYTAPYSTALFGETRILMPEPNGRVVYARYSHTGQTTSLDAENQNESIYSSDVTLYDTVLRIELSADAAALNNWGLGSKGLLISFSILFFVGLGALLQYLYNSRGAAFLEKQRLIYDLEQLFSFNLDLLCITSLDGRFLRINPAWSWCLGYPLSDLIHKPFMNYVHPEDKAATLIALERLGDGQKIIGFINRYQASDGSYRTLEWQSVSSERCVYGAARDVTEREIHDERLRVALDQKDLLLREVHHRIKNNLQIISSMLFLQASEINDPDITQSLEEAQGRILAMAVVHEALYQSDDISVIDFNEYIRSLVGSYSGGSAAKAIEYEISGEKLELGLDLAVHCGLLVNELITNSIKHAFAGQQEPRLVIIAKKTDDGLFLSVADNGPGFSTDFEPDRDSRLGIRLIRSLVEQYQGEIAFRNVQGALVEVWLRPDPSFFSFTKDQKSK